MLGWIYMIVFVLIIRFFIPKEKRQKPIYNRLFWLTEFSVIGMMIAFPIQGYALFSIVFSTMHILLSYVFCRLVWKDSLRDKSPSQRLVLVSILFMILSTFGVWCLGPAVSTLGKQSAFYQIAIQFFLHFQFNGWFILAILSLNFSSNTAVKRSVPTIPGAMALTRMLCSINSLAADFVIEITAPFVAE